MVGGAFTAYVSGAFTAEACIEDGREKPKAKAWYDVARTQNAVKVLIRARAYSALCLYPLPIGQNAIFRIWKKAILVRQSSFFAKAVRVQPQKATNPYSQWFPLYGYRSALPFFHALSCFGLAIVLPYR